MKPIRTRWWLAAMALWLLLLPLLFWWHYQPTGDVENVELFLPDDLSLILRLDELDEAWRRHWALRPGVDPENAVETLLIEVGEWSEMVRRYEESGARLRVNLIEETIFRSLGDEAWLLFGEWGRGDQPGTGQTGLVALIPAEGNIKSKLGPLLELVLREYQVERTVYRDIDIFTYHDEKLGRNLSFFQFKGWICVSMRRSGHDPLKTIIDHLRAGMGAFHHEELDFIQAPYQVPRPITVYFHPNLFWRHLRLFNFQRGRGFSDESESRLKYWQQRLDGIESITLTQHGPALLDLEARLWGPRIDTLDATLRTETATTRGLAVMSESSSATQAVQFPEPAIELVTSVHFIRMLPELAGFNWDEWFESENDIDWLAAGLNAWLLALLVEDEQLHGRAGIAIYPTQNPLLPAILSWLDRPPLATTRHASANDWARLTLAANATSVSFNQEWREDEVRWIRPLPISSLEQNDDAEPSPKQSSAHGFAVTNTEGEVALESTFRFGRVADSLQRLPLFIMDEDDRESIRDWIFLCRGLQLAMGESQLSVLRGPQSWRIQLDVCREIDQKIE